MGEVVGAVLVGADGAAEALQEGFVVGGDVEDVGDVEEVPPDVDELVAAGGVA